MDVTKIPFNSFLGIERCEASDDALLFLQDLIQYKNHLNTVHASAQFALGEAASGEYLLQRFKDIAEKETLIPIVRKTEVKFKKPAQGKIKASATISDEIASQTAVSINKKGRAIIPVTVNITDSSGNNTMTAIYEWFVQKVENPT
jgi:hypothetical protein